MTAILDTDVLSCIAKIKNMELLEKLFPKFKFSISSRTYDEIKEAQDMGYGFVEYIQELIDNKRINVTSAKNAERMKELEDSGLDFGDITSIALAEERNATLLSNDKKVKKEAKINVFNLEDLISVGIDNQVIKDKNELLSLIKDIESKDKVTLRNKSFLKSKIEKMKKNESPHA